MDRPDIEGIEAQVAAVNTAYDYHQAVSEHHYRLMEYIKYLEAELQDYKDNEGNARC